MSIEFKRTEHSDILVHWTGLDIDASDEEMSQCKNVSWSKFCLQPINRPSLIHNHDVIEKYLLRLRDTLKFGLWLIPEKDIVSDTAVKLSSTQSKDDGRFGGLKGFPIYKTCFTELKLSQARQHAYEYGRLGFGVKRTYLFRRAGIPMIYFKNQSESEDHPNWIENVVKDSACATNYLKHMSLSEDMNYKYISESEWRIVFPEDKCKEKCSPGSDCKNKEVFEQVKKLLVDTEGNLEEEVKKYGENEITVDELNEFKKRSECPRYLLPFDFELAVIIYPCPIIKILAEQDNEIRGLLRNSRRWINFDGKGSVKKFYSFAEHKDYIQKMDKSDVKETERKNILDELNKELGGTGERMMLPMEIDLDTISHF